MKYLRRNALRLLFAFWLSIVLLGPPLAGQIRRNVRPTSAIGFTGAYSQDFQTLSGIVNGTSSISANTMSEIGTLPNGGAISGWYLYASGSSPKWGANNGASNAGAVYSIYDSQMNRALGSLASGSSSGYFGVVLRNDTSESIVRVSVTYDAVIARNPNATVNSYQVKWRVSPNAPDTTIASTGDGTFNDLAGFWYAPGEFEEASDDLSFSTPTAGTGAPNGTQAAINPLFTIATKTQMLQGIGWEPGQYLYIRWYDANEADSDALAGVDNFQLTTVTTAADAVVSGQVVDSFGSGVSGAMVTLVSPRGERRTVRTSSFGYFRFMEVETGETYVISVASKRYRFEPRSVMVGDNIDDLRFTALP